MVGSKKIKIVTHNGTFHPDDIFAVATLLLFFSEKFDVQVIRTRDETVIRTGDYVVDVGGVYDELNNKFDHHQIEGAGKRSNGIPFASFGLVWKRFGAEFCDDSEVANRIDKSLVQCIDADDNGIQYLKEVIPDVYPYDIAKFFYTFNPTWKDEGLVDIDKKFMEAVVYAQTVIKNEIKKQKDKLEAKNIIDEIYKNSDDKRLIVFDRYYPAGEFLSVFPEPLFYVFPDKNENWVLRAIHNNENSFIVRQDLPLSWAGKRDQDLESDTGVEGAIFCHNGRFIAVAKTKEAILKMAKIALDN